MTCSLLEMVACCFRLVAIRVVLRGRAHLEWKVVVSGDQQSISDDQYFIDERSTIWGKGTCSPQLVNPLSVCPPFCNVSAKLVSLSLSAEISLSKSASRFLHRLERFDFKLSSRYE